MIYRLMIALLLFLWGADVALAKRVALVIGNSEYTTFTSLSNPVNDARLMQKALKEVGFEVTLVLNADQTQMKKAMLDFGRTLRKGVDASIFYYAGHGVQVNGENYLIPVEASLQAEDEVAVQAIDVNDFLQTMQSAKSPFNIVVLDACRNNPLIATRGGGGGLAPVNAPRGSYIAYATAPGEVALDGDGVNSPYTIALAEVLVTPGLKLEDVFKKARQKVLASTKDRQVPWETSSITGDFFFKDVTIQQPIAPALAPLDPIATDFEIARTLNTQAGWELFLARHKSVSDMRVDVAKQERDELLKLALANQKSNTNGKFTFPIAGKIVTWEIFFQFRTECENDQFASITSPTGRRIVVMDRGLKRCSGFAETFTSINSDEGGNFLGTEAKGNWKFEMLDLDRNSFSGELEDFWMKLKVKKSDGSLAEHRVSLTGLPQKIPSKK